MNVGSPDRWLRVIAGVALLVLGFGGFVGGALGLTFKVLGFVPLITGLLGRCPVYSVFGINTCPVAASRPSNEKVSV